MRTEEMALRLRELAAEARREAEKKRFAIEYIERNRIGHGNAERVRLEQLESDAKMFEDLVDIVENRSKPS